MSLAHGAMEAPRRGNGYLKPWFQLRDGRGSQRRRGASIIGIIQILRHPHVMPMIVSDYLSLWEVAHRWHGVDPNKTDVLDLPLAVQDSLRYLCGAVLSGDVPLYISDAIDASDGNGNIYRGVRYYAIEELPPALQSCAFARKYDKSVLDDHLISRHSLFKRSIWGDGQFPDFLGRRETHNGSWRRF